MFRLEALVGKGGDKHPHQTEQKYRNHYFRSGGHPQMCTGCLDVEIQPSQPLQHL